ncbi:MAG TPA: hypothetical protein VF789_19885 [Thermoanaerobaculia bacterium]
MQRHTLLFSFAKIAGVVSAATGCTGALAQAASGASASSGSASALVEVDIYVKAFVAILSLVAAIVGLPAVFLTYRKTRAEITKLELEAQSLRSKQDTSPQQTQSAENGVRINLENSPYTTVQVLADPRFLAPLLLLLDFIFAWVILTLAGHILSFFAFDLFKDVTLALLAFLLLLPIARQVLRVRAILGAAASEAEALANLTQARRAGYFVYIALTVSSLTLGILLLAKSGTSITDGFRYFAWFLVAWGVVLIIAALPLKSRFDAYLLKTNQEDRHASEA